MSDEDLNADAGARTKPGGKGWRRALAQWLSNNSPTMPADVSELREAFVRRFPKERLADMTLEEYAVGTGTYDNFSYWLEYKTRKLGGIGGGNAAKTGVWWSKGEKGWQWNKKLFGSPEEALSRIKNGLVRLVEATEAGRFDELDKIGEEQIGPVRYLRSKPLYLYFPEQFLPMWHPDHIANFLKLFDAEPRGEVLARNRQLLKILRGFPEFEGFDTLQMMQFLYDSFPQRGAKGREVRVWKIAPGEGARYWEVCRERGCISIGWLPYADYKDFADKGAITKALIDAGNKGGGASQIWAFTHGIKPGDIVVANEGLDTVVGVGRVKGDYLPPRDAESLVKDTEHQHARRVDWRITEPVNLSSNFFGQNTVKALDAPRWEQIKQAYLEMNPELEGVFAELEGGAEPPPKPLPPTAAPRELKELMDITERTRNVLLYGPPGTGKTWLVNHFMNYFLLRRNVSAEAAGEYWQVKGTEEGAALRARVRAEAGGGGRQPAYWWMVANEERTQWSWNTLFEHGGWFFGKRHLARNFEAARPGDFIFGYQARPHKQVVALARVERGLETREEGGEDKEGITIKPIKMLSHPLGWREVADNALMKGSEPVRQNSRGSMFSLAAEEAHELARMLNEAGNEVVLPAGARGDFAEFVTFHQSFAYEEFVEGLRPVVDPAGGGEEDAAADIRYRVEPGVFKRISRKAEAAWRASGESLEHAPKYLLVIDEINRANIAKVLGELITLIEDDKRLGAANELTVRLPYSGERFGVPPNLYILGTMNTADRSIALLDLALRRRFTFVEMTPDATAVNPASVGGVDLRALLGRLNERVEARLDRDHRVGHSYFIGLEDENDLRFAWYHRIVPLLQEYFYNDGERLREVLGPRFVNIEGADSAARGEEAGAPHYPDKMRYEVRKLDGDAFLEALRRLYAGAPGRDDPPADAEVSVD